MVQLHGFGDDEAAEGMPAAIVSGGLAEQATPRSRVVAERMRTGLGVAVALFPVKLLALWVIHAGQTALGIAVIVAAKLLGTALVGRLFILTEPQLMQFAWFAAALGWWRRTKERVREAVRRAAPWRRVRALVRRWRMAWRRDAR